MKTLLPIAKKIWVLVLPYLLAQTTVSAAGFLDMHVHTAGIGAGNSGCFVSSELGESYKFAWYLRAFGVTRDELERDGDRIVVKRIAEHIRSSKEVSSAVILAMDGVVDASGKLDRGRTQVYVPNDFVLRETARFPELLFGASINPYRPDAIARAREAKAAGAILLKWIPAIMLIDPVDPALETFYRTLAELDLPLLVHVGQERSFGDARDELGDPLRLEWPLSLGVTVIAAHIATTGKNEGEDNFERLLPLFQRHEKLYTDISSLTQINKLGFLRRALEYPGLNDRMIYGSDWPLQFFPLVSPWYQLRHIGVGRAREISRISNQWDRDVALKRAIGVPESVFLRSKQLLIPANFAASNAGKDGGSGTP